MHLMLSVYEKPYKKVSKPISETQCDWIVNSSKY